MGFVWRMVGRELRGAWRRLIFFFVCIAIGVAAIAAIRSIIDQVNEVFARESRAMTGGDIVLMGNRAWDASTTRTIEEAAARAGVQRSTEVVEMPTMLRTTVPGGATRLVELLAVDPSFPLYGAFKLEGDTPYSHALVAGGGVLVRPDLVAQLDLHVGDTVLIGQGRFVVRGVILEEPGRTTGSFSIGPRVVMDRADVAATGLLSFGSRARYRRMLQVPEPALGPLARHLRAQFTQSFVTVRTYHDTAARVREQIEGAQHFLGLVGYVILVLGGIGVWSVTCVFLQQKRTSIAALKCLGATSGRILTVYVLQATILGLAGSALGLAIAGLGLSLIPAGLVAPLGEARLGLGLGAAIHAAILGTLVSLGSALVPLAGIRRVKPLSLLREEAEPPVATFEDGESRVRNSGAAIASWLRRVAGRFDTLQAVAGVAVLGLFAGLAGWQAGSAQVGAFVTGGFVVVSLALLGAGALFVRLVQPLSRVHWFPLRHAVIGLGRPGHQTRVILVTVGLGCFFILATQLVERTLSARLSLDLRPDAPDLFFLDVQSDQRPGVQALLESRTVRNSTRLLPVARARVAGVSGREVNLDSVDAVRERGGLSREFTITWRDHLAGNERVIEGAFWNAPTAGEAEVSIEEGLRDRGGLRLGDRIRFDILGRAIEARVTSVRAVNWDDPREGGFMFVFRPGPLDRSPHAWLGIARGPDETAARARLQRDLVAQWPNVSVIDVREVLAAIRRVVGLAALGIRVVGGVALICGLTILVGAVAMTKFQRLREVALLKTLGASSRTIMALLALEYAGLGVIAGAVGAVGALGLSYALARWVLHVPWEAAPAVTAAGVGLTGAIVAIVGVVANLDVLRRKPLTVLRAG
jgi:putative ABC transport system permease protein